MNKEFFINNRKRMADSMEDNSLMIMFAGKAPHKSADAYYGFTPNRNFYYMTGIKRENAVLLIKKLKGNLEEILFIEKADPVMEKWVGRRITSDEARESSGIEKIEYVENFRNIFGSVMLKNRVKNIYLDFERRDMDASPTVSESFALEVMQKYPYVKLENIYHDICEMRLIKSEAEIENIRKAISITGNGIEAIMKNARPGMMEYELVAYFDYTLKAAGVTDFAFSTIAASGKNAVILHYIENNNRIGDEDLILFDLGAQYNLGCADISRTFPVSGKFTARQKEIYNIVLKAQLETIKAIKPGLPFAELNNTAKRVLAEECLKIGLIEKEEDLSRYYYHGVSHYLGMDTHDVGEREIELKPGMILTVEPGLYIEEESIGIRIEDNVLVTEEGCEVLSKDIIKTVEEIEEFMKK